MKTKDIFLETAIRIGNRLIQNAIWSGEECTWYVMEAEIINMKSRKAKKVKAGGTIYQGAAGIALFLLELYKIKKDEELSKTIKGAINYSINFADKLPINSFSFYSGRVGIAFAVKKTALYLNEKKYLPIAKKILTPLKGNETSDLGIDIIGGAAGAIPILLQMHNIFKDDFCLDMAINLGENLISKAHMEPTGWSWDSDNKSIYRNLLGYSHGSAGIGHAFIELFHATESDYFLYAAEQAFLYERQFFKNEIFNWPDFRHVELYEFIYNNELDKLKTTLNNNLFIPYSTKYMNAWCHGAPGVALSRIRANKITQAEVYKTEAENAIQGTILSLEIKKDSNYSLCHGLAGNCDALIEAAYCYNEPKYYKIAEKFGLVGYNNFEKAEKTWPCGTLESVSDTSLMLGEAGIGYFYLRLYSKNVPSVLLLTSERCKKKKFIKNYKSLQKKYIDYYFGNTIKSIKKSESPNAESLFNLDFQIGKNISDVTKIYNYINEYAHSKNKSSNNEYIKDLSQIEIRKYELSIGLTCFYKEFLYNLVKKNPESIDWNNIIIRLMPTTEIFRCNQSFGQSHVNNTDSKYFIVYRYQNSYTIREIVPFVYSILDLIGKGNSLKNIVVGVSKLLNNEIQTNLDYIMKLVTDQLKEMYKANFISFEKNVLYEDFIIQTSQDAVSENLNKISSFEKSTTLIFQILRTSKKHILSTKDNLYRLYQIDQYMSNLIVYLEKLNMLHYYDIYIEKYKSANKKREKVYLNFLDLLGKTFKNLKDYYIIDQ